MVEAPKGSKVTAPDWYNLFAAKQGAPAGWRWYSLRVINDHFNAEVGHGSILITGAVCTVMYKRGPRKGLPNWTKLDKATECEIIATEEQLTALRAAWELETGKCQACGGTGERTVSVSAIDGGKTQPCKRCRGTGDAPAQLPIDLERRPAADGTF